MVIRDKGTLAFFSLLRAQVLILGDSRVRVDLANMPHGSSSQRDVMISSCAETRVILTTVADKR